jgi:hypothetical protein
VETVAVVAATDVKEEKSNTPARFFYNKGKRAAIRKRKRGAAP